MTFQELCKLLATTAGGYTLWVGAGASIAFTNRKTPTWSELLRQLADKTGRMLPDHFATRDYPDQLEWIACCLGHRQFRRELRKALIEPIMSAKIDEDMMVTQAVIGARASTIVSFNIEMISTACFGLGHGGSLAMRTYLAAETPQGLIAEFTAGPSSAPVYFPHGILDQGNCVMTKSEYALHEMSLAVSTAVALCLGGDLLILGMSLGDSYLREAILKQRRWIRNVYWVNKTFDFAEWARVANVTCVEADYDETWQGIASTHLTYDNAGELNRRANSYRKHLPVAVEKYTKFLGDLDQHITGYAAQLVVHAGCGPTEIMKLVHMCEDMGIDIPDLILNDPRYLP